jgi:RNA polymerase sigma-70 factor (ECF subfamily)
VTEQEQKLIFENWLGQHKGLIFKIIRAYAFTAMDRDDLFQDVALQVWRSIPSFRHESAVTTCI